MICEKCGAQNADNAQVCADCGKVLNISPITEQENAPVTPPKQSKKPLLIIGGAVLIAVVALVFFLLSRNHHGAKNPEALAKAFIEVYANDDSDGLLKLFHADVLEKAIGDRDAQEKYAKDTMRGYADHQMQITLLEISDVDAAKLEEIIRHYDQEYSLKIKDAKIMTFRISMVITEDPIELEDQTYALKIGGRWYLGGL